MADAGDLVPQAAAIPFRGIGAGAQICLIRRKDSAAWGIPKGLIDPGHTAEETALEETWEEAGLRGRLFGRSIGSYTYAKWGARLTVAVYLLEVLQQADAWQEQGFRQRQWVSLSEAVGLLASHPVRPLLEKAIRALTAAGDNAAAGND